MNGSWPQAKMTLYLAKPLLLDKGPQRAKISFPAGWFPCPGPTLGLTRMAERPIVIVTRKLPDVVETRLRELFDARLNVDDKPFSREELIEAAKTANVLVPTVTDRIDRGVLSQAGPNLKLIAQFGTGVDNIDLETARNRSIIVTNTPGVLTEDTADMTMALIIAVPRRLTEGAAVLRTGNSEWHGWSPTWMLGHRIFGKRLGIVGMGRVGQAVARRAKAFGLQIHYHNRRRVAPEIEKALEATYWDSLDQMLARMDIISINCPHTPATYHLLSARRLALMKPSAYIINTKTFLDGHAPPDRVHPAMF